MIYFDKFVWSFWSTGAELYFLNESGVWGFCLVLVILSSDFLVFCSSTFFSFEALTELIKINLHLVSRVGVIGLRDELSTVSSRGGLRDCNLFYFYE